MNHDKVISFEVGGGGGGVTATSAAQGDADRSTVTYPADVAPSRVPVILVARLQRRGVRTPPLASPRHGLRTGEQLSQDLHSDTISLPKAL
jgi:hypothetical protein